MDHTTHPNWLRYVSRWAFAAGLSYLALLILFIILVLPATERNSLPSGFGGFEYSDFAAALANPALYRLFVSIDALAWIVLAGFLMTLALALARQKPHHSLGLSRR
ncbi:hypothetical protein [Deinococcus peraridilitoris]|uniref:Uncharacterized protein n=1 Tax=Deinococcus peraridilitoris (strain DSM 19664 / LMG 22246 / CIP 109416 / KR-200) TaxID=937777 RepID=L0A6B7_DEIPD|nr:hypothetical protein [Deinococcus peraridilitoris]AFZ69391.1 hypothetical protein Deipe_3996 [Deinococcus peraridilitoris DSM 19664]